jgi:hypothetical protein
MTLFFIFWVFVADEIQELWSEYENNSSLEANVVKDFDKVFICYLIEMDLLCLARSFIKPFSVDYLVLKVNFTFAPSCTISYHVFMKPKWLSSASLNFHRINHLIIVFLCLLALLSRDSSLIGKEIPFFLSETW